MKFLIIPNPYKDNIADYIFRLCEKLIKFGATPLIDKCFYDIAKGCRAEFFNSETDDFSSLTAVIVIGGDGTIIRGAKVAAEHNLPVLGINFGRLGFMAGLEDISDDGIERLVCGNYSIENRMMLKARIEGQDNDGYTFLNDAVISRGALSRIVDLYVRRDNNTPFHYRADGLIVSTPTGSTAYSFSAGGPIIDPRLSEIVLTPICPHSVFSRSIVFSDDSPLSIECTGDRDHNVFLTVDGDKAVNLENEQKVFIEKSDLTAKFIIIYRKDFYEILNEKFMQK